MIPGVEMMFGDRPMIVPPLNLAALERMQAQLQNYKGGIDKESIATVIDAVHSALRRNYPDVTREFVAENMGLENMSQFMEAVMNVAGLRRAANEALNGGKAPAAEHSAGASSTATS